MFGILKIWLAFGCAIVAIQAVPTISIDNDSLHFPSGLVPRQDSGEAVEPVPPPEGRDTGRDIEDCYATLTQDMWDDGNYRDAVIWYLQRGHAHDLWPSDVEPDFGAIDIIKSYATRVDNFVCTPGDPNNAHCDATDIGNEENCAVDESRDPNQPAAVTILKAAANFANGMASAANAAAAAADSISDSYGDLRDTFSMREYERPELGPLGFNNGGLVIASGVLSIAPTIGPYISALSNIAIGINEDQSEGAWEPHFEDFMDFSSFVEQVGSGLAELIRRCGQESLDIVPPYHPSNAHLMSARVADWSHNNPASLPNVLSSFAEPNSITVGEEGEANIRKFINAAAISYIWNASSVYVARVPPKNAGGAITQLNAENLCGDPNADVPFAADIKWCDRDGYMYVLQAWNMEDSSVKGFDQLGDYGLDPITVIRNSWRRFHRYGFNEVSTDIEYAEMTNEISRNDFNTADFQQWWLPVCDMGTITLPEEPDDASCDDAEDRAKCWFDIHASCRCGRIEGWPLGLIARNGDETGGDWDEKWEICRRAWGELTEENHNPICGFGRC